MPEGSLDIWTDSPVVRDYMNTEPITFGPNAHWAEVIDAMIAANISGAPVMDGDELLGMITEKDLLKAMSKGTPLGLPKRVVRELMSSPAVTIPPDMNVFTAGSLFRHNIYRRLPVVEEGKLLGVISRRDLLRAMKDIGKL